MATGCSIDMISPFFIFALAVVALWMFESSLRYQKRATVAEEQNNRLKAVIYDLINKSQKIDTKQ